MSARAHWNRVYETRSTNEVGWYRPHLETSLDWIAGLDLDPEAAIIDVGGGASTLPDDLTDSGYQNLTVLDISEVALGKLKRRLGSAADNAFWVVADITEAELPKSHFDLWHDRAVFHFLTGQNQRERYIDRLRHSLRPGGHLIIGTFAPAAPPRCSGLPVQRYDADALMETIGPGFELQRSISEMHVTPGGVEQMYTYCQLQRSEA